MLALLVQFHSLSSPRQWAGTISFDESSLRTTNVALNATTNAATASLSFVFTQNAGGERCTPHREPNLAWSINGTVATARGSGTDPNFYSFQGTLSADGATLVGIVYHPPFASQTRCGTFRLSNVNATNPQRPSGCNAHGPTPAPGPPGPATSRNPPGLWPAPAQYTAAPSAGKGAIAIIDPAALALECSGGGCSAAVAPAFVRGKAWALDAPHPNTTGATLKRIVVRVKSATAVPLQLGADESYSLAVNTTHAVIEAPTQFGAMHGLETLFQLVVIKNTWDVHSCALYCGAYVLRVDVPFTIIDAPRVRWRGLMIDTARHYLPVATIKHAIEAMAAAKMNALHWHLSDDQSFPLCLASAPQLCAVAAYRDRTGAPLNYTTTDVRDLVAFAAARGVRIIPELDLPGHSAAFARAAPSVYANCATSGSKLPDPRPKEAGGKFFTLLDAMMTEISSLFPDDFMHMGGDEIKTDCWSASAEVQIWAKAQNLTTGLELVGYFQQRVQAIVSSHGKQTMFWDEFWAAGLPALNSTFAEVRGTLAAYTGLLDAGRPTLTTGISEAWYLDHGVCNPRFVQADWEPYYTHDPFLGLSEAQLAMVLGGEVDMWGEGVDATNFESRVFPWASAVGERLWSPPARSSSISEAAGRLAEHRCMLVQRGVAAAPIGPGMC